ncbi:MAG: tRNA threonylcarbamoyladenosine dehydratase, partial [Cellulosilyticaceae bacterium]
MIHTFTRTEMLVGSEGLEKLKNSKVAIFGVGGVGSYTAEALARTGVGNLVLIDHDDVSLSNLNRQLHATLETVDQPKVEVMKARILSINPAANVETFKEV